MSLLHRWGLPALLLSLSAVALPSNAARATDDKAADSAIRDALKGVINEGADMYNGQGKYTERDFLGCYHLYEGALITIRPYLSSHPDLQKAIDDGLDNARDTPLPEMRAFVLLAVVDQIRDAMRGEKTAVAPPPAAEKTTKGKATKVESGKLTIKGDDGKEATFAIPKDASVTIDGKSAKTEEIKIDSTVAVTSKGDNVSKVEAKSPAAAPPPPKIATVVGTVIGVDKDKLTVSVNEKEKVYVVPADAKITIDDKDGKLADLKKDSTATITTRNDVVATIDEKNHAPPPTPKETVKKGKATKVEKNKLTIKGDDGKEATFTIPDDADVTIDGKAGKIEAVKADSSVTLTDKDGKITKVEVKSPTQPPPPPPGLTLWERLGGEEGVGKVVDEFVNAAAKDPKVNFFRDPTHVASKEEVAELKKSLVAFVSSATFGPIKYTGKSMKEAHKGMKITDEEFNAAKEDLKAALEKNGVKGEDEKAVLDTVEGTRKDIVEVPAKEDKKPDGKEASAGTIQGKVTYNGKPLTGGTLTLVSTDKQTHSADIDAAGTYQLKELAPGDYTVAVETESIKPKENPKPPDDEKPAKAGQAYVKIPAKYGDAEKSGLTVKVQKGENTYDIELHD